MSIPRIPPSTALAVVPIGALATSKSRLAAVLSPAERRDLVHALAARVIAAAHSTDALAGVAVVSPDAEALAWAEAWGATAIMQEGIGLNDGLEAGRRWALDAGADALVVILGDVPLLTGDDLARLVRAGRRNGVALAPDRSRGGTNALCVAPPDALPFAFGEGSFARHLALAGERDIAPAIVRAATLAFDVDTPADVRELAARGLWHPTRAAERRSS